MSGTGPGDVPPPLEGCIEDGPYRYHLGRCWDPEGPRLLVVGLNPSTADAARDDPTLRRCRGFARRWGFGGVDVVNLYARRATRPRDLWRADDPVGPETDAWIAAAAARAAEVLVAWGHLGGRHGRDHVVAARLPGPLQCLGTTQAGHPRHPLYIAYGTPRRPWRPISPRRASRRGAG